MRWEVSMKMLALMKRSGRSNPIPAFPLSKGKEQTDKVLTAFGSSPLAKGEAGWGSGLPRLLTLAFLLCAITVHAEDDLRQRPNPKPVPVAPSAPYVDLNAATGIPSVEPLEQAWTPTTSAPVLDRWRLLNTLGILSENLLDPYNQNTLKGDNPIRGNDEFLVISGISDTVIEPRRLPTPVGPQGTTDAGSVDVFGGDTQQIFAQTFILNLIYYKGNTTFKPPDYELHFVPALQINHVRTQETRALRINPQDGRTRTDAHIGFQELFIDKHWRNVSDRYDFDSYRIGIQPITLDFRGFLFNDVPLAVRVFGTRDNNRWQYNVGAFRRLEKETNSGLNTFSDPLRHDDTVFANLYRQDFPVVGFTSQAVVVFNQNKERDDKFFDRNGFLQRPASFGLEKPRNYRAHYLGYNGDGHFGRLNLSVAAYLLSGKGSQGVFHDGPTQIQGQFLAAEASFDQDWRRWRVSMLYSSPDKDPLTMWRAASMPFLKTLCLPVPTPAIGYASRCR
jgi:hypothetical protein